jgi:hypothetical protein
VALPVFKIARGAVMPSWVGSIPTRSRLSSGYSCGATKQTVIGRVATQEPNSLEQEQPSKGAPTPLADDVSLSILSASAVMVGVCLTSIGLFRVVNKLGHLDTIGDDLLTMDAFVFLLACVLSYIALRNHSTHRRYRIERLADTLFLCGLGMMVVICGLVVWAFM